MIKNIFLFVVLVFGITTNNSIYAQNPVGWENILILENYTNNPDVFQKALDNLNLTYTNTNNGLGWPESINDFKSAIDANGDGTYDGNWDLIIFNYDNSTSLDILNILNDYVINGGFLIMDYLLPVNFTSHALWPNLGFTLITGPPLVDPINFEASDNSHNLFNLPNTINSQFNFSHDLYTYYGHKLNVSASATKVANITGNINEGLIVINEQEKTIYNSINSMSFEQDDDSDGKLDIVELAENEISYFVPLSSASVTTHRDRNEIIIYPNPTLGYFQIKNKNIAQVEVYTIYGILILKTFKKEIDLSKQSKGIYFVKTTSIDNTEVLQKIVLN